LATYRSTTAIWSKKFEQSCAQSDQSEADSGNSVLANFIESGTPFQFSSVAGTSIAVTCVRRNDGTVSFTTEGLNSGLVHLRVLPRKTDLNGTGGRWTKFSITMAPSGAIRVQNVPTGLWLTVTKDGHFASHKLPQELNIHAEEPGLEDLEDLEGDETSREEEEEEEEEVEEEEEHDVLATGNEDEDEDMATRKARTSSESIEPVNMMARIIKLMHERMDRLEAELAKQSIQHEQKYGNDLAALWKEVKASVTHHSEHRANTQTLAQAIDKLERRGVSALASVERELNSLLKIKTTKDAAAVCLSSKTDAWCEVTKRCRDIENLAFETPETCATGWLMSSVGLKTGEAAPALQNAPFVQNVCPTGFQLELQSTSLDSHGDVCRAKTGSRVACPQCCEATQGKPFCVMLHSDQPCRVDPRLGRVAHCPTAFSQGPSREAPQSLIDFPLEDEDLLTILFWIMFVILTIAALRRSLSKTALQQHTSEVTQREADAITGAKGRPDPDLDQPGLEDSVGLPEAAVVKPTTGIPTNSTTVNSDTAGAPSKEESEPIQAAVVQTICTEEQQPASPVGCSSQIQQLLLMGLGPQDAIESALLAAEGDISVAASSLVAATDQQVAACESWEAEWDLLLLELQEMGFEDVDANKQVIRATSGNLKNAVQALVHEERERANAMVE
jgi:hypothetical protein